MAQANPATSPALPRLVLAGLAGDTGKTLISLGLIGALRARGLRVMPFKKGPDFIDAAWLAAAAGVSCGNLDTFLMSPEAVTGSVARAGAADIAVIEGNRGLYDGLDAAGTHSTAELAKLLTAPVVLVVSCTKATRTIAALVLGCRRLDEQLLLGGVILNRVGTKRQEAVIRRAVEADAGVPVLGAVARLAEQHLPSRHLGLVTAGERLADEGQALLDQVRAVVEQSVDVGRLIELGRSAPALGPLSESGLDVSAGTPKARIGVLRDRAFSFYYPENLTALEAAGAELVFISPLQDRQLPEIDGLYAGGGFPELYAAELAANAELRRAIGQRIGEGLVVWAECGGLMYLARELHKDGVTYEMVGSLPIAVAHADRPQGHGYVQATVTHENPFLALGTELRGHEFHYSQVRELAGACPTALTLERGSGLGEGRDGLLVGNVIACYTHLHALGAVDWAPAFVRAAAGEAGLPAAPVRPQQARNKLNGSLRSRVRAAVEAHQLAELGSLVEREARTVRHLLALTYQTDAAQRKTAAAGIGLAGRFHPKLVQKVIRRLIWAMNDESGTNAATAPEVLQAIADQQPELLLPMVPDLCRLAAEPELRQGISSTLRTVSQSFPGKVGQSLRDLMQQARIAPGDHHGD